MKLFRNLMTLALAAALLFTMPAPARAAAPRPRGWDAGLSGYVCTPPAAGYSATRISYDTGSCRLLRGSPFVAVIYLDDDESSWTEEEVLRANADLIDPALDFMEQNAASWNVDLDFRMGYYASYNREQPVKYNGTVGSFDNDSDISYDILDQAAVSLGFEGEADMHRRLQEYAGGEQVAFVLMMDKGGRSYCINSERTSGSDDRWHSLVEYCLVFSGFTDTSRDSGSDTVAHEMLHLFGAEDYYYPDSRAAMARKYYPTDIMLCGMEDLAFFTLEEYTAYCLGWTNTAPGICQIPGWL